MRACLVVGAAANVAGDALIVPLLKDETRLPAEVAAIDRKLEGVLQGLIKDPGFGGDFMEMACLHSMGRLPSKWVLALGVGKRSELDLVRLRNALQVGARYLRKHGNRRVTVLVTEPVAAKGTLTELARAVTEGITLGNFEGKAFKSQSDASAGPLSTLTILGLGGQRETVAAMKQGLVLAEATNLTRQWVNTPANAFTPRIFVTRVREAMGGLGVEMKVLEVADMRRLKMGALLAVARGSDEPARLIALRYQGGRKGGPTLGLVGKGITFDSGGISLKPGDGMEMMKSDMGGGAAVVGAMRAIAELKLEVNVVAVVPTTENMPSGRAAKPGDVVTASNGKTIEIINTDAEGRLILADGITYAINQGATHVVDIATLTGSISRTLGPVSTGAFSNDATLMSLVSRAAELAGERVWQLPLWADYDGLITSKIADIRNSTVPWAGATTAALFLREFVDGRPWVHLDIAGSAWQDKDELRTVPNGPTGAGTRLLAHLAQLLAAQ